ncbi:MAG TPA: hypothetical protein VJB08_00635 [Candidatus Nanoarchaeia archaeon]|nr:hypothetical protein [Candidatus Nanoarchaeia archaeon]
MRGDKSREKKLQASLIPKKPYPLQLLLMLLIIVMLLLILVANQVSSPTGRAVLSSSDEIGGERWDSCPSLLPLLQSHYHRYLGQLASGILSRDYKTNRADQLFILDFAATLVNHEPFFGKPCNTALVAVDSSGKVLSLTLDETYQFTQDACTPGNMGYLKSMVDAYVQCAHDSRVCYDITLDKSLAKALRESGSELLSSLNSFDIDAYCRTVQ